MLNREQLHTILRFASKRSFQLFLLYEQRWINVLADIDVGPCKHFEQSTRPRCFQNFKSKIELSLFYENIRVVTIRFAKSLSETGAYFIRPSQVSCLAFQSVQDFSIYLDGALCLTCAMKNFRQGYLPLDILPTPRIGFLRERDGTSIVSLGIRQSPPLLRYPT